MFPSLSVYTLLRDDCRVCVVEVRLGVEDGLVVVLVVVEVRVDGCVVVCLIVDGLVEDWVVVCRVVEVRVEAG